MCAWDISSAQKAHYLCNDEYPEVGEFALINGAEKDNRINE